MSYYISSIFIRYIIFPLIIFNISYFLLLCDFKPFYTISDFFILVLKYIEVSNYTKHMLLKFTYEVLICLKYKEKWIALLKL